MSDDKDIYPFLERLVRASCGKDANISFDYKKKGENAPRIDVFYTIDPNHAAGTNPVAVLEKDLKTVFKKTQQVHLHSLESNEQQNGFSVQGTEASLTLQALAASQEMRRKIGLKKEPQTASAEDFVNRELRRVEGNRRAHGK